MLKKSFLGILSAVMLIAAVVLSGCGANDPMLGKWITPVPGNSQLAAIMVNIEKNGDDQKTRVVTLSTYVYENRSTNENQSRNEMSMLWLKKPGSKQILPIENNIIRLPMGSIAYDQNRKCLVSDGIEFKKADEKNIQETKEILQNKIKNLFVGKYTRLPDKIWDSSSSYVVKNVIFADAKAN